MDEAIKNFGKQFDFVPEIVNKENLKSFKHILLLGMGGSHLAADVAKNISPELDITIFEDYGLPKVSDEFLKDSLVIASSYSGNTEEVVAGLTEALEKKLNCVVISVGGKLLETAKEKKLPYIQIPDTKIQPRSALGFSVVALAHLLKDEKLLSEIENLKGNIESSNLEKQGKELAEHIKGNVPIIYTSRKNFGVAYNWKIKFNETGKIPAFYNVFPELNHNEMTGFDVTVHSAELSKNFIVIFIHDNDDHSQIKKRMDTTERLYEDRGIKTISLSLSGSTFAEKIFNSLILADWTAFYTAAVYGAESNEVPMVEEFKKLIS